MAYVSAMCHVSKLSWLAGIFSWCCCHLPQTPLSKHVPVFAIAFGLTWIWSTLNARNFKPLDSMTPEFKNKENVIVSGFGTPYLTTLMSDYLCRARESTDRLQCEIAATTGRCCFVFQPLRVKTRTHSANSFCCGCVQALASRFQPAHSHAFPLLCIHCMQTRTDAPPVFINPITRGLPGSILGPEDLEKLE